MELGQQVVGQPFLVIQSTKKVTRKGDNYLDMLGRPLEGRPINIKVWGSGNAPAPALGSVILVNGTVVEFNGLQINCKSFIEDDTLDPLDFAPRGASDSRTYKEVLYALIGSIKHKDLRVFVDSVIPMDSFVEAPAATHVHHAYVGGLAEHTIEVAQLTDHLCYSYPTINRDIAVAAALLHDVGKVDVYTVTNGVPSINTNVITDHIVIGLQMMENHRHKLYGNDNLYRILCHCVAAHHGKKEYGSPVEPQCFEALVVNYADVISSRFAALSDHVEEHAPSNDALLPKAWFMDGTTPINPDFIRDAYKQQSQQYEIQKFYNEVVLDSTGALRSDLNLDNYVYQDGRPVKLEDFNPDNLATTIQNNIYIQGVISCTSRDA